MKENSRGIYLLIIVMYFNLLLPIISLFIRRVFQFAAALS
ncbi:MAG: hypothetical protein JETT_3917 [Candidatus Jettenia ecosi]|uniref:Uncharacterized protein n=1 Tax=Candidatus Jettenia ecosi TaxID=2494326 RepID=A0A533Q5L0_9BACT|nr:MAG: hypothetical protein JETT_3917 [Candidatus Jettenia ecosi]